MDIVFVAKLNKKLEKAFANKVHANLEGGCLYLTGELSSWDDIVRAGYMSVSRKRYTVVNDIVFTGGKIPPTKIPLSSSNMLEGECPDVLSLAAELSAVPLRENYPATN